MDQVSAKYILVILKFLHTKLFILNSVIHYSEHCDDSFTDVVKLDKNVEPLHCCIELD